MARTYKDVVGCVCYFSPDATPHSDLQHRFVHQMQNLFLRCGKKARLKMGDLFSGNSASDDDSRDEPLASL